MLLFSFVGVLLLRFEARRLFSVLFQEPPRRPRSLFSRLPMAYHPRRMSVRKR